MKRLITICMLASISLAMFAQATSLTVDNQTPGWLSSKINYGDQITVRNLKVTGYINATDLKFIGTLIQDRNLKGKIDLSDANIIAGIAGKKDNYMGYESQDIKTFGLSKNTMIEYLSLPKSLEGLDKILSYDSGKLSVDTLMFDCNLNYVKSSFLGGDYVNNYILGENVDSIPKEAFSGCKKIKTVKVKGNLRYIGDKAFYNDTIQYFNFPASLTYIGASAFYGHAMKEIIFPDSIHEIGESAFETSSVIEKVQLPKKIEKLGNKSFSSYSPDTIYIPNGLYEVNTNSFKFKNKQVWVFPENVSSIEETNIHNIKGDICTFILYSKDVVKINNVHITSNVSHEAALIDAEEYRKSFIVYVPKGMKSKYKSSNYWYSLSTGQAYYLPKGYIYRADVYWSAATFYEITNNVISLSLNFNSILMTNIGEVKSISPIIMPENADNKSVNWLSTNTDVCIVMPDGQIIATGNGTAVIVCTTVDGGFVATCTVTVDTTLSGIDETTMSEEKLFDVYSVSGVLVRKSASTLEGLPRGVYMVNGRKVVMK